MHHLAFEGRRKRIAPLAVALFFGEDSTTTKIDKERERARERESEKRRMVYERAALSGSFLVVSGTCAPRCT